MNFRVGQKVVCVDGRRLPGRGYGDEIYPAKGEVYTIRGLHDHFGNQRVWLVEITNEERRYLQFYGEPSFGAERFRPVVERKTDISIFTKMLTNAPERVA